MHNAEGELIEHQWLGDAAAISDLFQSNYSSCMRLARGVLRSEEDSRDAVQMAFLSAFRHLPSFRGESSFKTWLSRIVLNQCFMYLREPAQRVKHIDLDSLYDTGEADRLIAAERTPEKLALGSEILQAVDNSAAKLPEPLRQVFTLYMYSGLSLREVAATLGLTLAAVKTRLFRANLRMRSYLQPIRAEIQFR